MRIKSGQRMGISRVGPGIASQRRLIPGIGLELRDQPSRACELLESEPNYGGGNAGENDLFHYLLKMGRRPLDALLFLVIVASLLGVDHT